MAYIIEWSGYGRHQGPRWWHEASQTFGINKHAATVFETEAAAEAARYKNGLSTVTTAIVEAPNRYMAGTVEGYAKRALKRVS
jgi:hypothetical protein